MLLGVEAKTGGGGAAVLAGAHVIVLMQRVALLRMAAHNLAMEKGHGSEAPRGNRVYLLCQQGQRKDEMLSCALSRESLSVQPAPKTR